MNNTEETYLLQYTTYGNWQRDNDVSEQDPDDYYEQEDYE